MFTSENKVMKLRDKYANEDKLPKRIRIVSSFYKEELEENTYHNVKYYIYEEVGDMKECKADCIEECYDAL